MLKPAAGACLLALAAAVPTMNSRRLQTECKADDQCRLPCPMGQSGACVMHKATNPFGEGVHAAADGSGPVYGVCECVAGPAILEPVRPLGPEMQGPAVGPDAGPCAQELASTPAMPGAPTPTCDEQGGYMPVQCYGSVGSCWCSDEAGNEIDGTREMCRGSCNVDPITCLAARGAMTDAPAGKGGGSADIGSSTAALGERCAQGFCEDQGNCPQCERGLFCRVPKGMACAGTCYGTCAGLKGEPNPFGH